MATILTKRSNTASSVPLAGDLTNSTSGAELAVNTADKRVFTKDSGGTVVELGTNPSSLALPNGTANGVAYLNGSKVLTTGSALTFDGSTLAVLGQLRADRSDSGTSLVLSGVGSNFQVSHATSGFVTLLNSGGGLIFSPSGSEQMRLTSTGLGIGTSSPAAKLHSYISSGANALILENSSNGGVYACWKRPNREYYLALDINNNGGSDFSLYDATAGATRWTVDSSGNLGIGTSSPSSLLDVNGIGSFTSTNNGTTGAVRIRDAAGNPDAAYIQFVNNNITSQYGFIRGLSAGGLDFNGSARIDSSGNLGIGTSSPGNKMVTASSDTNSKIEIQNTSTAASTSKTSALQFTGTDTVGTLKESGDIYVTPADNNYVGSNMLFYTRSSDAVAERARIDSSGNLLVGQTAVGTQNTNGFSVNIADCSTSINHSGKPSGTFYTTFNYNGSVIGSVTQNGTTGVLYNLTSDYRLKNNAVALTGAKDFVMALQPKTWDWWDGSGKGVGFIAHEFMEVAKYSGNGEKDAVDADGKPVYQSIQPSSSEVMANLVALVQEQQAIIEQLKARLDAANL